MSLFDFFKKENIKQSFVQENLQNSNSIQKGRIVCNKIDLNNDVANILKQKYIAFDIETTGLDLKEDRIIELGAVLFENRYPVSNYGTLINPNKRITDEATKVNNISNDMINNAPLESDVYPKFVEFLGEALSGNIIICAHNAQFDISFLQNTLERLGYTGTISYIDTLYISRYTLQLENYKQGTIADYFGINVKEAHRAVSDAEVCGQILSKLLDYEIVERNNKSRDFVREVIELDEFEKIIFAYVLNAIHDANLNYEYINAIKSKSGNVDICYFYKFLRYKLAKKGKYLILPSSYQNQISLPNELCNISEGGSDYIRVYFRGLSDLNEVKDIIINEYKNVFKMLKEYVDDNIISEEEIYNYSKSMNTITLDEAYALIKAELVDKKLDNYYSNFIIEERVSRSDIEINAINDRVPLNEIKNLNDWEKGYDAGIKYWIKGDELRKSGNYIESIKQFDKARYNGYLAPVLYESYAMAYHQLLDYDNEIDILDEGIDRLKRDGQNTSTLIARRDKALQTKNKLKEKENAERIKLQQKEEKKRLEKEQKKIQEELKEEELKNRLEKRKNNQTIPVNARIIIQLDDNHNVINTYPSIAEAVRQTGINSKSIRDAANGVQKHAGGYVWEYSEDKK